MLVVLSLPGEHHDLSIQIRVLLDALIDAWVLEFRRRARAGRPYPALYESGVRYQPEPADQRWEAWDGPDLVLRRGWGDCDDLVLWRVAELRAAGERAGVVVIRELDESGTGDPRAVDGTGRYHVAVRRSDGRLEDPSVRLMRR